MKKFRLLIVFSIILCCLALFCACDETPVQKTPEKVAVDPATLMLQWNTVKDANLYVISIQPQGGEAREVMASKNSYSLASLEPGTYQIKVRAKGKEEALLDSDWSAEITFLREVEPGFAFELIEGGTAYEVTNKGNAKGEIVIPDFYRGKPVISIGKKAFFNKSDVTSVKLGANVTRVGDFAFANCSYLTSLSFSEGLLSIGESAFASCRLLAGELVIPAGVTEIPANAFAYCGELTALSFGNKLVRIGNNAFTDCKKLTRVTLPDSLLSVGEYAFSICVGLEQLELGKGISEIGAYAFSGIFERA